jgi:hypothetical protein
MWPMMSPGDIFFLYTDGVNDGSDKAVRQQLEEVMREHYRLPAKDICNAFLQYPVTRMIVCGRAVNKIASTIRPSSSSSKTED